MRVTPVDPRVELVRPRCGWPRRSAQLARDRQQMRPQRSPQGIERFGMRIREVPIGPGTEAIARHVDGRSVASVVVERVTQCGAFVDGEHGPERRNAGLVEVGSRGRPVDTVDAHWHRRATSRRLHREERGLHLGAAEVLADRSVTADDAVAGHDDRDRVVRARARRRPHRGGPSGRARATSA